MAPRSASRLAAARPKSKPVVRKRKAKKPLSFSCYRFVVGFQVHYRETRKEAMLDIAAMGAEGVPQKVTITSNAELVKYLRENTL